jgi:hypothetical protein
MSLEGELSRSLKPFLPLPIFFALPAGSLLELWELDLSVQVGAQSPLSHCQTCLPACMRRARSQQEPAPYGHRGQCQAPMPPGAEVALQAVEPVDLSQAPPQSYDCVCVCVCDTQKCLIGADVRRSIGNMSRAIVKMQSFIFSLEVRNPQLC